MIMETIMEHLKMGRGIVMETLEETGMERDMGSIKFGFCNILFKATFVAFFHAPKELFIPVRLFL